MVERSGFLPSVFDLHAAWHGMLWNERCRYNDLHQMWTRTVFVTYCHSFMFGTVSIDVCMWFGLELEFRMNLGTPCFNTQCFGSLSWQYKFGVSHKPATSTFFWPVLIPDTLWPYLVSINVFHDCCWFLCDLHEDDYFMFFLIWKNKLVPVTGPFCDFPRNKLPIWHG